MVLKTFNLDNYFTKIAENDYLSHKNFLEEEKMLMEELFQKIQDKIDEKAECSKESINIDDIEIRLSADAYKSIYKEGFLESIPLSFSKERDFRQWYVINVRIKDLKNIEERYNQIMQERIPLKENYIKEKKERLIFEYNNSQK